MKRFLKGGLKVSAIMAICFAFVVAVHAIGWQWTGTRSLGSNGASTDVVSSVNLTTRYKSGIDVLSLGTNSQIETQVQLPVFWWYETYAISYQTISSLGLWETFFTANTSNKTKFVWTKITGGSSSFSAKFGYADR